MRTSLVRGLCTSFAWACVLSVLAIIATLLGFLLVRGVPTLGLKLLFGDTPPLKALFLGWPVFDGLWPACCGTLCLVLLATAVAAPMGVAGGAYLAEYATGQTRTWLTLFVDILAGIPSIVMGLFGFALILLLRRTLLPTANTCLLLAACCLALLVLPYLINATRVSLEALSPDLRLTGTSLGLTRMQTLMRILLPSASKGILSGLILAVGRAAEDTAVILLTGVVANAGTPSSLTDKFEALPFSIYFIAAEHQSQADLDRGFGAALLLLFFTTALFLGAHKLRAAMDKRWKTGDIK